MVATAEMPSSSPNRQSGSSRGEIEPPRCCGGRPLTQGICHDSPSKERQPAVKPGNDNYGQNKRFGDPTHLSRDGALPPRPPTIPYEEF